MNFITGLVLVFIISGLTMDYKRDGSRHMKAKVFHTVCLFLIGLAYANSFRVFGSIFSHFDQYREIYGQAIGPVSANQHFAIFILHTVLSVIIMLLVFQLARRKEIPRRLFISILPLLATCELFNFYRGWISDNEIGMQPVLGVFVGILLYGSITAVLIIIYKSSMMKRFFRLDMDSSKPDNPDIIDIPETNSHHPPQG